MEIKKLKILVGFSLSMLGILFLLIGATYNNGELVNGGSFLLPLGFGYLMGSA